MAAGDKFFAVMKNELAVSNGVATLGPDGLLNASQRPITDSMPTQGSSNPVQSGGVFSALSNKVKKIISFESIGLTEETASIEGIVNALNDGDLLLVPMTTVRTGTGIVPANYGTMRVHRRSASYVMFEYQTLSDKWIGYYNAGTSSSKWSEWAKIATATPPQEYDLPLAEGMSAVNPCTYRKNQFSEVSVGGSASGTIEVGTAIATLPSGFRPPKTVERPAVYASANGAWTGGTVAITTDGIVWAYGQISATSVSFAVDFVAADY